MLEKNEAAKEAATCIARGIISSLDVDADESNVELLSGLASNLAPCLQVPELKALERVIVESLISLLSKQLQAPSLMTQMQQISKDDISSLYSLFFQKLPTTNTSNMFVMPKNSISAILSISASLLEKKEIEIGHFNYLCCQPFKMSEE